jgi:hypothetical protein
MGESICRRCRCSNHADRNASSERGSRRVQAVNELDLRSGPYFPDRIFVFRWGIAVALGLNDVRRIPARPPISASFLCPTS